MRCRIVLISLNLVQLTATANRKVFNLDVEELRVSADLQLSGTWSRYVEQN